MAVEYLKGILRWTSQILKRCEKRTGMVDLLDVDFHYESVPLAMGQFDIQYIKNVIGKTIFSSLHQRTRIPHRLSTLFLYLVRLDIL